MAWGILEDTHMVKPPGTEMLGQKGNQPAFDQFTGMELKKADGVVLVPQPSDSPNDPLNWSPAWKRSIVLLLAFTSGATVSLGSMITPGIHVLAKKFDVSTTMIDTYAIGFMIFWTGFATFFTAASATIWGKRPVFMISTFFLLFSNIWGYLANSFGSFMAMRVVQGISSAPLETLVTSTISDLFYVHQRGAQVAIWGLTLTSGVLLGQIISGQIIESLGIQFTFGIAAILFAVLLPAMYFMVPETVYYRPTAKAEYELDDKTGAKVTEIELELPERTKRSYSNMLTIFRGRLSSKSFWGLVAKPLPLICFPAVLYSVFIHGTFFTWLQLTIIISETIFGSAPYNLSSGQIGMTNIPLLAAGLISSPISGWMADKVVTSMSRRNGGIFEPEYRLTLIIIAVLLSTIGFIGFGVSTGAGLPLATPLAFMTLIAVSVPFATQVSFTYVVDCHPTNANQAFVTISFSKAIMTFVGSAVIDQWLAASGAKNMFLQIAAINFIFCTFTVPTYMYGKRFRSMVARNSFLSKL